jgi:hypothetical protein
MRLHLPSLRLRTHEPGRERIEGRRCGYTVVVEHTGVVPPGAVHAHDLADIAAAEGAVASVYLTTEAAVDNAARFGNLLSRSHTDAR